jgi:FixJ family two-component response regulator
MVHPPPPRDHFAVHKGRTVLPQVPVISIVDDDASVRVATNRLVRSLGYVAHTFASADEFLRSPQANESSCVIADVQMPGMSGVELQRRLVSQGHGLPIIFMTAFPDERIKARVLEAGAVCFLTKPFDGSTLIKYLDAALKRDCGKDGR